MRSPGIGVWWFLLLATGLPAAGCGGAPRPVEMTEEWTSGDDAALGIETPPPAPTPPEATPATSSDGH